MIKEIEGIELLKNEFIECEKCKAKPGSTLLCDACLHNRSIIYDLKNKINNLIKQRDKDRNLIKALIEKLEL